MMLFISFLGERISMVSGSGISIVGAPLVEQYNIHYGHAYNGHHSNYIWHVSHR